MPLTKAEIIQKTRRKLNISRKKSAELIEKILNIMKTAIHNGDEILVSGFGKFCINDKKPRRGRNPVTGEPLMLSGRRVVTFRCSGKLKRRLNNKTC